MRLDCPTLASPTMIKSLTGSRPPAVSTGRAETLVSAIFYSITNCQEGLRGISFGNFLIKQVAEDLGREFPRLKTFATLSPIPGFRKWLNDRAATHAELAELVEVLAAEIAPALGKNRAFDSFAAKLKDGLANPQDIEMRGRELTQGIALAMQGALLLRHAPAPVSEAFCASRLAPGHWGAAFGTLPATTDFKTLLDRAWPAA